MEEREPTQEDRISIFDLDALREAFQQSARSKNFAHGDWPEQAARFVKKVIQVQHPPRA